jgi:transposase
LRAERGDLSPLPHGGGARSKLSEEQKLKVVDFVAAKPDVTIGELRQEIKKKLRVELSVGAVWNVLDALGLTRKKVSPRPRSRPARARRFPEETAAAREPTIDFCR